MKTLLLGLGLAVLSSNVVAADWQVSNQDSIVNFISVKKGDIAEVHKFTEVAGKLDDKGAFSLSIPLTSVMTNVEIRDTRMKEILFEVEKYPSVKLTAKVDAKMVDKLAIGGTESVALDAELDLHGTSKKLMVNVRVAKLAQDKLMVTSEYPIILNAADFGLSDGVEKLRELAGLSEISKAVPVSFVLTLSK
ncbi:YceI family protein [Shewanella sp. Isolate11]|uniref:YceI family protein n=1 Tax=Shewanella sp. Isolate11 TaxID=2908530 RepID=UPI001EFCD5A0|nr:YceI family protein [Shewanella sp. Isolate11]MCG9696861.1 YceI family protein [Shewanella sp. Isolate11]